MEIKAYDNESDLFNFCIENLNTLELACIRLAVSLTHFDLETRQKIKDIITEGNATEDFYRNFGKTFFNKLNSFDDFGQDIPEEFFKEVMYQCDSAISYADYKFRNRSDK